MSSSKILYLTRADVQQICAGLDVVQSMRHVLKLHGEGKTIVPGEAYMRWTNALGESIRTLNMPGFVGGGVGVVGTKVINSNTSNIARGLPRASGLTMLYDATSGEVACVMEGAYMSAFRTAGVTALAVDLFQGRPIESMAIVGAGELAQHHLEILIPRLETLRQVRLFDLREERMSRLRTYLVNGKRVAEERIVETTSAEDAIRSSQLVVTVTTTTNPYIELDWLDRGCIVVNVSLDDLTSEVFLNADRIFVDDWSLVRSDPHRLLGRLCRAQLIAAPSHDPFTHESHTKRVAAEIGDVLTGRVAGRRHDDELVVVNPFGLAIEDVALASEVHAKAIALGMGYWLPR